MKKLIFAMSVAAAFTVAFAAETMTQPAAGSAAPEVKLTSNDGAQADLADFKGTWVVLYFYPNDFTRGCTPEAQNFQRDMATCRSIDTVMPGVSGDSAAPHK